MKPDPVNLNEWKELALTSPESVVDRFIAGLSGLQRDEADRLVTAVPRRDELIGSLPELPLPGEDGPPLFGVPFLLQDLFDVEGIPTVCGAQLDEILDHPADASCRLFAELREHGAWFGGKLVPTEFGLDLRGRGRVLPPGGAYAIGGGAGACAEAVAHGLAPVAFGLDTTGGLRIPAAYNGVFAYRMGHNRLARDGVFPVAPSLDAVGWVTRRPGDMADVLRVMYTLNVEEPEEDFRGCFLGDLGGAMEPGLKAAAMEMVRELSLDEEPSLRSQLLPSFKAAGKSLAILAGRELYSVHRYWVEEYRDRYDQEVLRLVRRGMDHGLAVSDNAAQVRDSVCSAFSRLFESYDYLVIPAVRVPSPLVADWTSRMDADVHALMAPASLAGLPVLQLPVLCPDGRSGGLQIVFNPRKKEIALSVLATMEGFYGGDA